MLFVVQLGWLLLLVVVVVVLVVVVVIVVVHRPNLYGVEHTTRHDSARQRTTR